MKILIIGTIGVGKTMLCNILANNLKMQVISIDELRKKYSDGSIAGEYLAYSKFIEEIESDNDQIYEFSGAGIHKHAIRFAIDRTDKKILIIYVKNKILEEEIKKNTLIPPALDSTVPYPFKTDISKLIRDNIIELERDYMQNFWKFESHMNDVILFENNFSNGDLPKKSEKKQKNLIKKATESIQFQELIKKIQKILPNPNEIIE